MSEVRPHHGWVVRKDGTRTDVRYVPTGNPVVFLAVSIDGEPIEIYLDESLRVDVIGPGQSIEVAVVPRKGPDS
jgi:hypothetical protein